jgi:L-aspartate oxidase
MQKYDVLIIGAGIAGLYAAMQLPKSKKVLVVCKDIPWECNTFYAQGGMSTALNEADIAVHVEDTMSAGAYHNDKEAVEILSRTSLETTPDIIEQGMKFDNRHQLQKNTLVYDLLIENGRCYGVKAMVNYQPTTIYADDVIIASGGIGSLYALNTNSRTISADIHGICVEKGIELSDMEFMQFHPTVFVDTPYARKLLLTEALRGEGAHVVDENGRRFLFDYDKRGELASRDIVARGIFDHKRKTGGNAYLDFSMFEEEWFEHRFPNITRTFGALGYHFPKDKVSISPAFHYANGGIKCDTNGCIEGFDGLYVIGEAARTGVHGANRLASNSLLEGMVFAKRAVDHLLSKEKIVLKTPEFEKDYGNILHKDNDKTYKHKLRQVMWDDIGIIRTTQGLHEAKNLIYDMKNREIGRLLELRLNTASAIVDAALARKESLGSHYMES